jgi:alkanesulfonate monooxygenase SsuD/methylene tetrahydromethanopterin reductase-like flavin-dependent oxidoreductase (luciferase family)
VADRVLRLGLELPAVGTDLEGWRAAAATVEASTAGAVWIAAGGDDPCTLAGSLVPDTTSILLGVVSGCAPTDRHPSVLARDATALDVLSGGRAAVLLTGDDVDRLAEAADVCRLLFTEDSPSYRGRHFVLGGAANRPPPVQAGGPPIAVAPGGGAVAGEVGNALSRVDAVVVAGGPAEMAVWRAAVTGPALLRRGPLGREGEGAALLDVGVDGLIVQLSGTSTPSPETLSALVAAVGRR